MARHEQNLGVAGRVAGIAGRVNRFNPVAGVVGAGLGRVGVSHDSILGKAFNVGGRSGIHAAMAHHMANSRVGRAAANVAGKMASRDPIIRAAANSAAKHGLVNKNSTAGHALGLNRPAGGLAGMLSGLRKKSAKGSLANQVKNAQFEAKHHRVHGKFA